MKKKPAPRRRTLLYPLFTLSLIVTVLGVAAWTAVESPALEPLAAPTPTYARSFGFAQISKPTYTPTVTATVTATLPPTATSTPTPEAVAQVEILVDTPTVEYTLPSQSDPAQAAPSYGGSKYILVDISEQHMYVYEGNSLVFSFVASTGMRNSTRTGLFSVLNKIPNAYGATWNIWMPNWLGIYWAGGLQNGIHALPILSNGAQLWAGYLGTPISYGCVVLGAYESKLLYDWAEIGTPVEIRR